MEKALIGVLGIGLEAYWAQFDGLKERIEGYQRRVEERVAALGAEVVPVVVIGLVVPHVGTCVVRWLLAPPGKDADPQESLCGFQGSRTQPGGDQRPPGGVRTCVGGH